MSSTGRLVAVTLEGAVLAAVVGTALPSAVLSPFAAHVRPTKTRFLVGLAKPRPLLARLLGSTTLLLWPAEPTAQVSERRVLVVRPTE